MNSKFLGFLDYIKRFIYPKKYGFKIPIFNGIGTANLLEHEIWLDELLAHIISPNSKQTVLDIGANVGQTLLKLKDISRDIQYIGFEPNPTCLFYLEELISVNKIQNCEIIPVGVSNQEKLMTLFMNSLDSSDSSASIISGFRNETEVSSKKHIACLGYEDFKNIIGEAKIALVKIDVEGAEYYVIDSLNALILKDRPIILCEILPVYDKAMNNERWQRQIKIQELMIEFEYTLFRVSKNKNGELGKLLKIDSIGIHSDMDQCEYVFCPKESNQLDILIDL